MAQVIILIQDKPGGPDGMVNVAICDNARKGRSYAVELGKAVAAWMQDPAVLVRIPSPQGNKSRRAGRKGKTK